MIDWCLSSHNVLQGDMRSKYEDKTQCKLHTHLCYLDMKVIKPYINDSIIITEKNILAFYLSQNLLLMQLEDKTLVSMY